MSVKGHQKSSSTGRFTEHFDDVIAVPVETANKQQQQQQKPSRVLSLRRNNRKSLPPTAEVTSQPPPSTRQPGNNPEPLSPEVPGPHRFPQKQPPQQQQPPPPSHQQPPPPIQHQQSMPANSGPVDGKDLSKRNSSGPIQQANTFPQTASSKTIEPPPVFLPPQHKSNSMSRKSGSMSRPNVGTFNSSSDGINPAEVLINRLDAWRVMIKMLIEYFDEISKAETQVSRHYQRVAGIIQLPIRDASSHFKEQNGVQDLCVALRDGSKSVSEEHDDFAKFIQENVSPALIRLKKEIKDRMRDMKNDDNLHVDTLWKEMDLTRKTMANLDKVCATAKLQHPSQQISQDPWLANLHVLHQLKQQIAEENRLHERMISLQREIATFEGSIVQNAQSSVRTFYDRRAKDIYSPKTNVESVMKVLDSLKPDTEWQEFVAKHGDLLVREDAGFRDYRNIDYANKHERLVQAVKKGKLSRKTGVMRSYHDRLYALTPAGYLHEFRVEDFLDPELSIYVPTTTVAILEPTKGSYGIEIRGRNTVGVMNRERTFTLRANTQEDQQEWYELLQSFANRPPMGPAPVPAGVPMDVRTFYVTPVNNDDDNNNNNSEAYPPANYRELGPQASTDTKHAVTNSSAGSSNHHVQFDDTSVTSSPLHSPPKSPIPGAEHDAAFDGDSDDSFEEAPPQPSTIVRQDPPIASPKPKHAYIGGFKPMRQDPSNEAGAA